MRTSILIAALAAMCMSGVARADEADSLKAEFVFSASVRNPAEASRSITVTGTDGIPLTGTNGSDSTVTRKNPFDFELATGIDGDYGPIHFLVNEVWRRENNTKYWNHEAQVDYKHQYAKTGARFRDDNGAGLELATVYLEAIVKSWVGIGSSYQWDSFSYTKADGYELNGGKLFARVSLAKERHKFFGINLTVRASYEYNPDRYRLYSYVDVRNLTRGRYSLVPFLKWERIKNKGADANDAYQAKVALTIQI